MKNSTKLNKSKREELLKRYCDEPELETIKNKYSKKSLNPLINLKNKNEEKREIDSFLIEKEKARKEEEKRIKREEFKAKITKNKTKIIVLAIATTILSIGAYLINSYNSTVREINFINTLNTQYVGDVLKYEYEIIPKTAKVGDGEISIKCSNINLIGENNVLESEGSFYLSICYNGEEYDSIKIEAQPVKVTDIKIDNILVGIGNKLTINPTVEPENATYKELLYTEYDEKIISIKDNVINGLGLGTTNLTISTKDGFAKTIEVNVIEILPEAISITGLNSFYEVGDLVQVYIEYTPEETTDKEITFSSSNSSVATIDDAGRLKAVGSGMVTITAEYNDDVKCSKNVSIILPKCKSITVNSNYDTLYVGSKTQLNCVTEPEDCRETTSFTSSDTTILGVDSDGLVTARSVGKATITAKCGTCSDSYVIKVIEKPAAQETTGSSSDTTTSGSTHIEGDGIAVYYTAHGECYHKDPSCPASNKIFSMTLEEAKSSKYRPCEKCWN